MNKKGFTLWSIIIMAIVLLIVGGILIFSFNKLFGKEADTVGTQIDKLGDSDHDGVIDTFDRCSATPAGTEVTANGCVEGQPPDK
jgi:hypothetical protein